MARGADFESGNVINRAKLSTSFGTLICKCLQKADELAIAMEARCYRGGEHRTRLKELKLGKVDGIALTISIMFLDLLFPLNI